MPEPPEYLPAEVRAWAEEHRDVLELVAGEFVRDGVWPTTTGLTRRLAREDRPTPIGSLLGTMPRPLGFVENHPGRIVLLLFGLSLTSSGRSLVDGFFAMLERSLELYKGPDEPAVMTRAELGRIPGEEPWLRALNDVVVREAPWLGTGTGAPEDDWSREITPLIVNYWNAATPDEYLRIRAEELGASPQFGFAPPSSATALPASSASTEADRDVFISHASEDKNAIARPLADELLARGHTVWFDEYELVLGDSLTERIDEGLAHSTIGVVILSHDFFAKPWPKRELAGLTARLIGGERNVLVPIWHGLTREEIVKYSPPLADRLAGNSADGVEKVADEVERALERRHPPSSDQPTPATGRGKDLAPAASPQGDRAVESSVPARRGEPGRIHDEMRDLVSRGDAVGLDELLRGERHAFESAVEAVTADHINHSNDEATVRDAGTRLASAADRRLASLIPLALHQPDVLEAELRAHAGWATSTQLQGGGMTWQQAWRMPFWMIGMTLGALATRLGRYPALRCILETSWINHYNVAEPFVGGHLGEAAEDVVTMFGPPPPEGHRWSSSPWAWLVAEVGAKHWLADRYPDWLTRSGEPEGALTGFDLIACIARGLQDDDRQIGLWTINAEAAERLARRLHSDPRLRRQVAEAVGTTLQDFDQRAPGVLASVHSFGMFSRQREVANILQTGSAR